MPSEARGCESLLSGVVDIFTGQLEYLVRARTRGAPRGVDGRPAEEGGPYDHCRREAGETMLSLLGGGLGCEGLRFFGELREASRVPHRHIGQNFAVEGNPRSLQAVNQMAVADAILAGGRANALNPQPAILTLLRAPIAEGITVRSIRRFLCGLIELALGEEKALCPLKVLLAPCPALCAAFYAWHGFAPLVFRETQRLRGGAGKRDAQRVCFRSVVVASRQAA